MVIVVRWWWCGESVARDVEEDKEEEQKRQNQRMRGILYGFLNGIDHVKGRSARDGVFHSARHQFTPSVPRKDWEEANSRYEPSL